MLTGMRALSERPRAVRHPWLVTLLLLGIVGMHGLVLGGTASAHHGSAPVVQVPAPDAPAPDVLGHAGHAQDTSAMAGTAAAATPSSPVPADAVDGGDDGGPATALALCLALLLALAVGVASVRRTTWPFLLDRLAPRLTLPAAPAVSARTPVPRFTVMRC